MGKWTAIIILIAVATTTSVFFKRWPVWIDAAGKAYGTLALFPPPQTVESVEPAMTVVEKSGISDFFGSLDRFKATQGLFVTASTFTSSARQATEQLSKRIVLMDGDQLTRLMIFHGVVCVIEETLHVKKMDEEFFE